MGALFTKREDAAARQAHKAIEQFSDMLTIERERQYRNHPRWDRDAARRNVRQFAEHVLKTFQHFIRTLDANERSGDDKH